MNKTHAFSQCVAVFQGGGAKGVAFAGAISEAEKSGIAFVGAIGASAGAIAAALVASGMRAEEVHNTLKTDFSKLLRPVRRSSLDQRSLPLRLVGSVLPGQTGKLLKELGTLGRYSSEGIGFWVDTVLKNHLKLGNKTALFKDLPRPLAVLATDLREKTFKVWSTRSSPTAPVGFAVRASCSLPFFFQPVESEGTILVDGGVISNLPLFLKSELGEIIGEAPLLCFRLVGRARSKVPKTFVEFGQGLIDAIMNGVTDIQLSFSTERQVIDIDTNAISATDFYLSEKDKAKLVENGESAVREFIVNEQTRVARSKLPSSPAPDFRDGLLEKTIECVSAACDQITIMAGDLSWLSALHLSLLAARLRGIEIRIISARSGSEAYAKAVRGALALGARILEQGQTRMAATIIDATKPIARMITIETHPPMHGRIYEKPEDQDLISLIYEHFELTWNGGTPRGLGTMPVVTALNEADLVEAIKTGVPQYNGLTILCETVNIADTKPLLRCLNSLKLARLKDLDFIQKMTGIGIGGRIEGSPWIVTPPVVERLKNGQLVLVDGTHRLHSCLQRGIAETRVIVVDNPRANLPAVPAADWNELVLHSRTVSLEQRYKNYRPENFRKLRAAYESYFDREPG